MDCDCGEKDCKFKAEMKGLGIGSKKTEDDLIPGEPHHEELQVVGAEGRSEDKRKPAFGTVDPTSTVDPRLGMILELKKEAKVTSKLVEDLKRTIDPVNEEIRRKEDEVSRLTRRITILKVKLGNQDPLEKAHDQGKDAVSIFPEEVWRLILGNLTDLQDQRDCSNTCSLFQKILQGWKLPTLLFQVVFPYLFQQFPQNRILELRLVSKGWRRVVDQYMQGQPQTPGQESGSGLVPLLVSPMEQKQFHTLNKFNFTDQVSRSCDPYYPGFPYVTGMNPFLGRVATIIFNPLAICDDSADDFGVDDHNWHMDLEEMGILTPWDKIYSFLQKFGEYIFDLTVDASNVEGPEEGYAYHGRRDDGKMFRFMIMDLASLAPNLRKLRVLPSKKDEKVDYNLRDLFPIIPNLESVEVAPPGLGVVRALIRSHHSKLKTLHLTGNLLQMVWKWGLVFPNLAELHLDHLNDPRELKLLFCTAVQFIGSRSMSKGRIGMPRLRKLGINLRGMEKGFDLLLLAIHKLFATTQLTTLRICGGIGSSKMFQRLWWPCCMSPTLRTLEVEHGEGDGFYNFLIHFPHVENVNIFSKKDSQDPEPAPPRGRYGEEGQGGMDVNEYIEDGRMYKSNIWERLPRLKLFTFKWDKFTRAGYEEFKKKKADRSESKSLGHYEGNRIRL